MRPLEWLGNVRSDLAIALRLARRAPLFTASATLVLAVGIGATTAVYSVLREALLRPLPYAASEQLLQLVSESPSGINRLSSVPQFVFWREALDSTKTVEDICAFQDRAPGLTLEIDGRTESIRALRASADYFAVFRAPLVRGGGFTRGEDHAAAPPAVVLTHGFWLRHFGGRDVVGESLWLANRPHEIVGVLGPSFETDPASDVIVPLGADPRVQDHTRHLRVVARLAPRVSVDGARRQIAATTASFRRDYPFALGQYEFFTADTLHAITVGAVRPTLQLLAGAVTLVLFVACANVAALLLSRGRRRAGEVATRTALGASRSRIVRQLVTETLVLALLGTLSGIPLGYAALKLFLTFSGGALPVLVQRSFADVSLDAQLVAIGVLAGLITGAVCGLVPAMTASRADLTVMFKAGGSPAATSWRPGAVQPALLVAEVAGALVLLVCTAMLLESVGRLRSVDRGFQPANLITLEMPIGGTPYRQPADLAMMLSTVGERLDAMAGVASHAATFVLPTDTAATAPFVIADRPLFARGAHHGVVRWEVVGADYFSTLRVARLDGRLFGREDRQGGPAVAIVNRAMAQRFWGRQSVLHERLTLGGEDWRARDETRQIVGVVADVRGQDAGPAEPTIYIPLTQIDEALLDRQRAIVPLRWILRATGDPRLIGPAAAETIEHAAPATVVTAAPSMAQILAEQIDRARFAAQLLSAFAGVSVLLALIGLYGFVATAVADRQVELSIRAALGAEGNDLLRLMARQGIVIVVTGIVLGGAVATLAGAGLESLVVGTRALSALQLGGLALLQLATAAAAMVIAAWPVYSLEVKAIASQGR